MITKGKEIPTYEELEVQDVALSSPFLKAGALHMGKQCEAENNEFMLCRMEEKDPRKCINEGKVVTSCAMKFFQVVKRNCAQEFYNFAMCLDRGSQDMSYDFCRKTQTIFDDCMKEKAGIERPGYGYFCEPRIHETKRPQPMPEPPPVYPDALVEPPSDDIPRQPSKYQGRPIFF
ncbi:NADH dehydrogenase [ubiquinone] 1 alpha subcomplex subunit 8 [Orchesella cincta]|uniref:NADH dehydrogenase [ubiquinone] 1 alpha subcomplex subunit 8 n=1 Tax=Orchesella cincta TaxID=48709 RepID=A0A1D2N4R1_ORCCI|nr:NADH dehydrogenase [ubiquinone] 1 alpha subcomplex subunit 8 [Orchesella cincta]